MKERFMVLATYSSETGGMHFVVHVPAKMKKLISTRTRAEMQLFCLPMRTFVLTDI